ncbi:MAG: hypothetical protein R3305_00515 [Gammaproteobacteria bacterium]|nr:hypothetical protein [Gammaproteobacteria bacterium]
MINRREVLASGLAASLLARSAAAATDAREARATRYAPTVFIGDERFADARAAVRAAAAHGATVRWLGNDVTPIYEELDLALRAERFAVAGLTTAQTSFVIERLGWDRDLRTVYRGRHTGTHAFEGHSTLIELIGGSNRRTWAQAVGRTLAEEPGRPAKDNELVTSPTLPRSEAGLVSWLLVPRSRVAQAGFVSAG